MTIEIKSGIADGVETVVLYYVPSDEYDVQESLEAHLALGFALDGREYTDGVGNKHRILTRPSDEEPEEDSDDAPEIDATDGALALAEESGLDLALVEGTGKDGRIKVGDVRDFLTALEDYDEFEEDEEEGDEEIPSSEEPEEEVDSAPLPFEEEDEDQESEDLLPVEELDGSIEELEEGE